MLVGTVADDELRAWYHAADALAFPSLKEGWGLAVLEAMAAGLPVVATDIPVFREYLTPGVDALLVPPADPAALAGAMADVMADADLRRRLADAGPAGGGPLHLGRCRPPAPGGLPLHPRLTGPAGPPDLSERAAVGFRSARCVRATALSEPGRGSVEGRFGRICWSQIRGFEGGVAWQAAR